MVRAILVYELEDFDDDVCDFVAPQAGNIGRIVGALKVLPGDAASVVTDEPLLLERTERRVTPQYLEDLSGLVGSCRYFNAVLRKRRPFSWPDRQELVGASLA